MIGDGWKYRDGALHQTRATQDAEFLRLKQPLPRDFDVTCRYTTTGGAMWKSVTFRFDESADQQFANFVYTSANVPGPKVQVAFTRGGTHNYPGEGQQRRPIEIGKTYELRFAVRDRLVNVWLDEEFVVAYQFSERQPEGRFSLSGFDATVAFDSIAIQSLPADVKLIEAKNADVPSPQAAELAVKVAEAKVKATQARLASVEATLAADKAKFAASTDGDAGELAKVAAVREAETLVADAEQELLAAGADEAKTKAAQDKLAASQEKLKTANEGTGSYTSLKVTRKALERTVPYRRQLSGGVRRHKHGSEARVGAVDDLAGESADRPRGRQSRLAAAFWPAAGGVGVRLWPAGETPRASRSCWIISPPNSWNPVGASVICIG